MTLEQARRFEDLLAARVQDEHYAFDTIFDQSSFFARRRSRKKFKLLQRISPKVRKLLRDGEKVRYLARGTRYSWLESFLGGVAIGFLNRRALIVTNQRIVLLQISSRLRPKELVEQIRYSVIDRLSRTLFGNTRIRFATGERITLANVARADRRFLVRLIEFTRSKMEPEAGGLEDLCSYCYQPVDHRPPSCPHCGGSFKSPRKAALLSLLFPGIGDWYLGHHVFAAVEIAVVSIAWMWLLGPLLRSLPTAGEVVTACSIFFVFFHGSDALVTRHIAGMGLYPGVTEKPRPTEALLRFATVVGVFLITVIGAVFVNEMQLSSEGDRMRAEEAARLAATPEVQQFRAAQAARVEQITVARLAERIVADTNDWSVIVLYSINNPNTPVLLPQLVDLHSRYANNGVGFLIYSIDFEPEDLGDLPPLLAKQQAGFPPASVKPWAKGELSAAMTNLGIDVGMSWANPLVAVRNRQGAVVLQGQGVNDLSQLEALLSQARPDGQDR